MSSLLGKLKKAFSKTTECVSSVFSIKKIDTASMASIEDSLLKADFGIEMTADILARVGKEKPSDIVAYIRDYLIDHLSNFESDLLSREPHELYVILVVGVNGNGKTTSVAKLANHFQKRGLKTHIAACDTFRAAATEQLNSWAKKIGCSISIGNENSDPAGLVYKAYQDAKANNSCVLIVDTAGRLHTRSDLMDELQKMKRVLKKFDPVLPHETVLVLDGTTGQTAFSQIHMFNECVGVDSVIVTKLDSSSKGGAIFGITKRYKLPISAVCFGETVDDICAFSAKEYTKSIFE